MAFDLQTSGFVARPLWQMTGLIVIGIGLFKNNVFNAVPSTRFYGVLTLGGFGLGVPLVLFAIHEHFAADWALRRFLIVDGLANYWSGFLVGLGWVGLTMLACRHVRHLGAFAAVGRLSLTNYLFQSVLFTAIFYGHGLGLFARVQRAGQLAVAVGVAAFEIVTSVLGRGTSR